MQPPLDATVTGPPPGFLLAVPVYLVCPAFSGRRGTGIFTGYSTDGMKGEGV